MSYASFFRFFTVCGLRSQRDHKRAQSFGRWAAKPLTLGKKRRRFEIPSQLHRHNSNTRARAQKKGRPADLTGSPSVVWLLYVVQYCKMKGNYWRFVRDDHRFTKNVISNEKISDVIWIACFCFFCQKKMNEPPTIELKKCSLSRGD